MADCTNDFEIEARSLDAAITLARTRTPPPGHKFTMIEILDRGGECVVQSTGDTEEAAFQKAPIPSRAVVLSRRVVKSPTRAIQILAGDEPRARSLAMQQAESGEKLAGLSLAAPGKRGFLGIRRTPNVYVATFTRQAVVEVSIRTLAKVRINLCELPGKQELLKEIAKFVVEMETQRTNPSDLAIRSLLPRREKLTRELEARFNSYLQDAKAVFPHDARVQEMQPLVLPSAELPPAGVGLPLVLDALCDALQGLVERVGFAEEEPQAGGSSAGIS